MGISVYTSLLLKDYRRKAGEIKALRKDLREIAKIILTKEHEVDALEAILKSREPEFDPSNIKPIATHPRVSGLKNNRLTTLIMQCLREAGGETVSSDLIKAYVIFVSGKDDCERSEIVLLGRCVQKRLKGLAAAGRVIRHHNKATSNAGLWSLPSSE